MQPVLPNFLVIGAQKSGTTALAHSLRNHPEVFLPEAKEAHHFGTGADEAIGGASYLDFFRDWGGEPLVGEATPNYLTLPEAPRQISRILPDVKLISILRNPIDRAYSAYWHAVREGAIRTTFDDTVSDLDRLSSIPRWSGIASDGQYFKHLEKYRSLFKPEQLHILLYEEMVTDPARTFIRLAEFLGIGKPPLLQAPRRNPSSRSKLPYFLRSFTARRFPNFHNKGLVPFSPPAMSIKSRDILSKYFRSQNEKLGEFLGRDLSFWK